MLSPSLHLLAYILPKSAEGGYLHKLAFSSKVLVKMGSYTPSAVACDLLVTNGVIVSYVLTGHLSNANY